MPCQFLKAIRYPCYAFSKTNLSLSGNEVVQGWCVLLSLGYLDGWNWNYKFLRAASNLDFFFYKMFQETTRLQDFRTQKQEELELKHVKELEDFDTNSSMGSSGSNTLSLKHRSTSSISTVSNSSTSSTRSTENNSTVVQQQTNDERLQVSAGPLRV